ncbi:hypothetical protein E4U59_007313 [Claviceps monticola]|nr:hypothetical protein E4U59_007313 [Claviceps monticola]
MPSSTPDQKKMHQVRQHEDTRSLCHPPPARGWRRRETWATIRSSFFIKKDNAVRLTVQEFYDAINSDGREVKALINRIVRFSSSITGTRIFWTAERR